MQTRYFALIAGIIFLVIGIIAFVPGLTTMPHMAAPHIAATGAYGYLFGLFPVNWIHNLVHVAFGVWGLAASRDFLQSRNFARGTCIIYALATILGLFPGANTLWGMMPMFGHDIWLHAIAALVAGYYGYVRHEALGTGRTRPLTGSTF